MNTIEERIKAEIDKLVDKGDELIKSLIADDESLKSKFMMGYQQWYTRGIAAIRELLPERLDEFKSLYQIEKRREININKYCIQDYLIGITLRKIDSKAIVITKFSQQILILNSALSRLHDILYNIKGAIQTEILDSEIIAAKELLKSNHLRSAGTVAGVVLERHFSSICSVRGIKIGKRDPHISDFNDKFKQEALYDVPTWRFIQRLSDIRNYCCHHKDRDPTKEEVDELIRGVEKIIKTIH